MCISTPRMYLESRLLTFQMLYHQCYGQACTIHELFIKNGENISSAIKTFNTTYISKGIFCQISLVLIKISFRLFFFSDLTMAVTKNTTTSYMTGTSLKGMRGVHPHSLKFDIGCGAFLLRITKITILHIIYVKSTIEMRSI